MDKDDSKMNNSEMIQWLKDFGRTAQIQYFYGNSKTKIEAVNANLENIDGDVLLVASDDMIPIQKNYDEIIFQCFKQEFPCFDGAIKFWDGFRNKEDYLMTLTVIGFSLYKKLGHIYNPIYKSVYADDELTRICMKLGKLKRCDMCIIQHQWVPFPWDELHARNENKEMYKIDGETFKRRLSSNFA